MDSSILLQQPLKYTNGGIYMARSDIPSGWDKIRQNVQETERLMGQKQYNQSMIKARQTVEYMVKLQCDQAGIVESSMDAMIRELYNSGWISKSTAEHSVDFLKGALASHRWFDHERMGTNALSFRKK